MRNEITRRIDRTDDELHLVIGFERPPSLADAQRVRETVKPWDIGHLLAERIEKNIATGGEPMLQLGIQWDGLRDGMELPLRTAMAVFLGLADDATMAAENALKVGAMPGPSYPV